MNFRYKSNPITSVKSKHLAQVYKALLLKAISDMMNAHSQDRDMNGKIDFSL